MRARDSGAARVAQGLDLHRMLGSLVARYDEISMSLRAEGSLAAFNELLGDLKSSLLTVAALADRGLQGTLPSQLPPKEPSALGGLPLPVFPRQQLLCAQSAGVVGEVAQAEERRLVVACGLLPRSVPAQALRPSPVGVGEEGLRRGDERNGVSTPSCRRWLLKWAPPRPLAGSENLTLCDALAALPLAAPGLPVKAPGLAVKVLPPSLSLGGALGRHLALLIKEPGGAAETATAAAPEENPAMPPVAGESSATERENTKEKETEQAKVEEQQEEEAAAANHEDNNEQGRYAAPTASSGETAALARRCIDLGDEAFCNAAEDERLLDAAEDYYMEAASLAPPDDSLVSLSWGNLAAVFLEMGDLGRTVSAAEIALDHNPTNLRASNLCARALRLLSADGESLVRCRER